MEEKDAKKIETPSVQPENRSSVSPLFQITFIILSIVTILFAVYKSTQSYHPQEARQALQSLTPEVIKEYGGHIQLIDIGLIITRFESFNMTTKDFTFDGVLWFKFTPGSIAVDTIDKFSFENGSILEKSQPNVQITNGKISVNYTIRARFSNELNYSTFPFDTHRLVIMLVNRFVSPREINFQTKEQNFNVADVSTSGWTEYNRTVREGYIFTQLNTENQQEKKEYPAVFFEIDYVRNSIRYSLSILLPLILIFYLALFSISLPIGTAISMTAACITAILAYRFVIENLSPKTGFFMISDYLFFLFLGATIFVFVINVVETNHAISVMKKRTLVIFIHACIIIAMLYLLFIR